MKRRPHLGRLLLAAGWALVVAACGARTGLLSGRSRGDGPNGGSSSGSGDGAGDGAGEDTLPPLDGPAECPDPRARLVYVITSLGVVMSFTPATGAFVTIGTATCGDESIFGPVSMAVNETGVAYVLYDDGNVYRVSLLTASCHPTSFTQGGDEAPVVQFGMAFAAGSTGAGETLFAATSPSDPVGNMLPSVLESIDTTSFAVHTIGTLSPSVFEPELAGTGSGELFALSPGPGLSGAVIDKIDLPSAQVAVVQSLPAVQLGNAWAMTVWEGDYYLFTALAGGSSIVRRVRASDGAVTQVATAPGVVVGAGTAVCVPSP